MFNDYKLNIITVICTIIALGCTIYNLIITRDMKQKNEALERAVLNVEVQHQEDVISGIVISNAGANLENIECSLYPFLQIQYLDQYSESREMILELPDTVLETVTSSTTSGVIREFQNSDEMIKLSDLIKDSSTYEFYNNEQIKSISIMYFVHMVYTDVLDNKNEQTVLCITGLGDAKAKESAFFNKRNDNAIFSEEQNQWFAKILGNGAYRYTMNLKSDTTTEFKSIIESAINNDGGAFLIEIKVKHLGTDDWHEQIKADIGDTVRYRIHVENKLNEMISNVHVRDILPTGLTYLEGTTTLTNSTNPEGIPVSDNIMNDTGINVGSYNPGGDAWIYFNAVVEGKESEGNVILRNIAQVSGGSITGTQEDTADVFVSY